MNYIESILSKEMLVFQNTADVLVHMFCVLGNGVDSNTFNPPVKRSYIDDDGNTKYVTIGSGHYLNADYFDNLEIQCPTLSYPFSENSKYQPYTEYRTIQSSETREGIKAAIRYFARCIESITEKEYIKAYYNKTMKVHENCMLNSMNENKKFTEEKKREILKKYKKIIKEKFSSPTDKEIKDYMSDMQQWKQNLHLILSEIDKIK